MIRVFTKRNKWTPVDDLAYVGYPPLFRPPEQPVRISVVFTWDISFALEIKSAWEAHYNDVQIGGPAFDAPGDEFVPGRFIKDGVTFTSRGCGRRCPWCFVPKREGRLRELTIQPGHIIQDNNFLQCSKPHVSAVFDMLREQNKAATFSGGLDTRLLNQWNKDLFDSIKIKELWFACDTKHMTAHLKKTAELFCNYTPSKRRCYVMIGFDGESIVDAEKRLEKVYDLGFLPFCQLYQGNEKKLYSKDWCNLQRKWSRPAAYRATEKVRANELPGL